MSLNSFASFASGCSAALVEYRQLKRTYSKSTGWRLMPITGGAIQLANLPASVTRPISEPTKARSPSLGSQSPTFASGC